MDKVMLATGMMVTYGYVMEHFIAWYSGNPYEVAPVLQGALARADGAGLLADGLLQLRRAADLLVQEGAHEPAVMWVASLLINVGMWCERFNIVVTSLHRDFLPSKLGELRADLGRHLPVHRHHRPVLDAVPAVPEVRAGGGGHRGQGAAPRAGT